MTIQRTTPVAVLLTAVLAMGTGIARAQETVRIAVYDAVSISPATTHIIVTGVAVPPRTFTSCLNGQGFDLDEEGAMVVVVDHTVPPVASKVPEMYFSEPLAPGTRLLDFRLVASCTEGSEIINVYECEIVNPNRLGVAFVTTPAGITLAGGHEAVVGKGTDEFGVADAVCVKKGQKSIKTEIASDILFEAGDRLTDFLELEFDPATGETLYGAWLEY